MLLCLLAETYLLKGEDMIPIISIGIMWHIAHVDFYPAIVWFGVLIKGVK
jgi:hypothetical protein